MGYNTFSGSRGRHCKFRCPNTNPRFDSRDPYDRGLFPGRGRYDGRGRHDGRGRYDSCDRYNLDYRRDRRRGCCSGRG
ncbi:MAG: hypothetical protein GX359_09840 [Clostridiales bacterium]|nr:hypothetical protein [Clostridiales bacterium]